MTRPRERGIWRVLDAFAEPLGLFVVAFGGAKLNGLDRAAGVLVTDARLVIAAGLPEVALGLLLFFNPTRRAAAVACSVWFAVVTGLSLAGGHAALVPGLLALSSAIIAWHQSRHRGPVQLRFPQPLSAPPSGTAATLGFAASLVGVSFLIRWAIGGTAFWLALPLLALGDVAARRELRNGTEVLRTLLMYLLVLGIGVSSWWGFVGHYFMSDSVAASVGWPTGSPFQLELAFYHLGFGIVGLMCLWYKDDFWMAVVVPISVFALGAASVHVADYMRRGNTSPGNWGFSMFFGDVAIPETLLIILWLYRRRIAVERLTVRGII